MDWVEDFEHELVRIRAEMDRVFNTYAQRSKLPEKASKNRKLLAHFGEPATHLAETEHAYLLSFELPDLQKGDMDLSIRGNLVDLKVKASMKDEDESQEAKMRIVTAQEFNKVVALPPDADPDSAHAVYREGMLRVEFKKKELPKKKRVDIK